MTAAIASARKSLGEYKPLIVYANGSTEVCEKSPERAGLHTRQGYIPGKRMARGTTYANRAEAVVAAQAVIEARRQDAAARLAKYEVSAPEHLREKICADVRRELETWGGR